MAKSKDSIELAKDMFDEFLSKADPTHVPTTSDRREKAKAAGRLGGLKGGPIRSHALSAKRKQIVKKAAGTRSKKQG